MGNRSNHNEPLDDSADILQRLNTREAGAAWSQFVDSFSPLIMRAVRQFEFEQERANDCFLFVCEKLSDNEFHRLKKFRPGNRASFRTWLSTVVFNLCVDWHRKEFGRATMLPAISALPAFDQSVYRYCFDRALDRETSYRLLRQEFPDLTREQMSEAMSRVHQAMTPRQRWRAGMRNRVVLKLSGGKETERLPDSYPGPEQQAEQDQRTELMRLAMSTLTPEQRLLLQLRYEQGLTLARVAEVMNLGDPYRARRKIQAAIDALSEHLPAASTRQI